MGVKFKVSAPGKVILFGEHSVVYCKKAIAATLNLRTHLELEETQTGVVQLNLPSIQLKETFPMATLLNLKSRNTTAEWDEHYTVLVADLQLLRKVSDLTEHQRLALLVFLHCLSTLQAPCTGLELTVTTELSLGAGQGSSASYSLVLATAFILLQSAHSGHLDKHIQREGESWTLCEELIELVLERAMSCEKLIHGNPSGVDHTVALLGSAVGFVKGTKPALLSWQGGSLRVLMVDSKVPRNTKHLVEAVRMLKERHPGVVASVLDAMDHVAVSAANLLQQPASQDFDRYFSELVRMNHGLLRTLNVSHPSLEHIVSIAYKHGVAAKLTGAGGGGFAFVFLPASTTTTQITLLTQELKDAGYDVTDAQLAGPGLQIHSLFPKRLN